MPKKVHVSTTSVENTSSCTFKVSHTYAPSRASNDTSMKPLTPRGDISMVDQRMNVDVHRQTQRRDLLERARSDTTADGLQTDQRHYAAKLLVGEALHHQKVLERRRPLISPDQRSFGAVRHRRHYVLADDNYRLLQMDVDAIMSLEPPPQLLRNVPNDNYRHTMMQLAKVDLWRSDPTSITP